MNGSALTKPAQGSTLAPAFSFSDRLSFTIEEAAAATGLTRRQIEGAILRGELRRKIVGRTAVIPATSLRKLVGELP